MQKHTFSSSWISQLSKKAVHSLQGKKDPSVSKKTPQSVKNLPTMQETWVQFLGQEDPLENGMEIHSSILAWRIQWTKEPGELQFMGSQRVRDGWATNTATLLWLSGYFCWWRRFGEYMMKIYKVFGGRRPKAREIFFFFTFHNIKILKYLYVWMVDKNKTKAQR